MSLSADQKTKLANVNRELREKFTAVIETCLARGVAVVIHWGYRSTAEQTRLYANRANNPNPVAKPGLSPHEWGVAIDATPLPRTFDAWNILWSAAKAQGLHLGVNFAHKDPPHFELEGFNHGSTTQKWPKPSDDTHSPINANNAAAVPVLIALDLLTEAQSKDAAAITAAVKKFQGEHSLKVDGVAGPLTTAALKEASH